MDRYLAKPVDDSYNQAMLSILKASPINAGGLHIYFDKSPNIFEIARMKYPVGKHVGFFLDDQLKGFGSLGLYDAFVEGVKQPVFTLYHFYLLAEARGRQVPHLAIKDFLAIAKSQSNYGLSIMLKGNRPAESYIGRRIENWMPPTRVVDELVVKSILFSLPKKNDTAYKVREARLEDLCCIVKLLDAEHRQRDFGLVFNEDSFLQSLQLRGLHIENYVVAVDNGGRIKGVCLPWDCTGFRRTRVISFSPSFYPVLLGYKILQQFFPMAALPGKEGQFNELTITDYAVENRSPAIMHALLTEVYRRNHHRHFHFMNWASCASDPLLTAAKGFWYKDLRSHIIFTSFDPESYNTRIRLPYIDIAFI